MQSEELTQFYRDYLQWVKDGAPEHRIFARDCGLCECAISLGNTISQGIAIFKELREQFKNERLNPTYPFNLNDSDYSTEIREKTAHCNELRLRWVVKHAKLWGEE